MSDIYQYDKKQSDEQTMIKADTGKRKKEQFIEDLSEGDVVNDFFAVKLKTPPRSYKRGTWFSFVAADKTGEIAVKFWGGENKDRVQRLYDSFEVGDVLQLRSGNVEIYDDKPQISINEKGGGLRKCTPEEYDTTDFVPSLEENQIQTHLDEIKETIDTITDPQLKVLLKSFFSDSEFVEKYSHTPSAITHHHNYVGGNLQHTVGVLRLCKTMCETYSGINEDLVVTGAILHDIGKIKEYTTHAAIDKSDEGNFLGHIIMGDHWLQEKISRLRNNENEFDPHLEHQLRHIILSHHGKYEWGSPRIPKTAEACLVHQADLMDSQVKNYLQQMEDSKKISKDEWVFVWDSDLGRKKGMYLGTD